MMPAIEVTESTYLRLQKHVRGFGESPETVIVRLLDTVKRENDDGHTGAQTAPVEPGPPPTSGHGVRTLNPDAPGELRHTKVVRSNIGSISARNWNELMVAAHELALQKLGSFHAVASATIASVTAGKRNDSGYHFQPNLGFSIQNVDSHTAWRYTLHLAKRLAVPVEVSFVWRGKDGAAYPGESGLIRWSPDAPKHRG